MTNPVSWLLARPLVTHTLLAALYTFVVALVLKAVGFPLPAVVATLMVSPFWYGREAGQREHDLKHAGTSPIMAWLGAEFAFKWDRDNLAQWLVAAGSSAAVAAVLTVTGL
jgi:hypothetical protein